MKRLMLAALALAACDFGYKVGPFADGAAAFLDAGSRPKDGPLIDASGKDAPGPMRDAAADGPAACPSREVTVIMRNLAFQTPHLSVAAGTRVTWVNEDAMVHDITEGDPGNPAPRFASGTLTTGQRWSHDFCKAGQFVYHCAAHPNLMRDATVMVAP